MSVLLPEGINTKPPLRATVITDASYHPDTKAGGWAAWVKGDGGMVFRQSGPLPEAVNSTVAEVMAAANGVFLAANGGATQILLQSDCMAVIHLIQGKTQSPRILEVWARLMSFTCMRGVVVTARHVKGHGTIKDARTWVNDWCDRHARTHMERMRGNVRKRKTNKAR